MKRMLWIAALLLTACQDQTTSAQGDLVKQAVDGPRRRRCAAPADRTRRQGRRQVLGAGTIAGRRRRAAPARDGDLRDDLGSRQRHGADDMGPRSAISAARGQAELHGDRAAHARLRHRRARAASRCRAFASPRICASSSGPRRACCSRPWTIPATFAAWSRNSSAIATLPAVSFTDGGNDVHHPVRSRRRICPPPSARATTTTSPAIRTTISCSTTGRLSAARAGRPVAVLPDQQHRSGAAQLCDGHANPAIAGRHVCGSRRGPGRRQTAGHRQRAVSMGAAPAVPDAVHGQRRDHLSRRRRAQAGRAGAQRAARPGRHRQQSDRRDEGLSGRVRCSLWRAAIALGRSTRRKRNIRASRSSISC